MQIFYNCLILISINLIFSFNLFSTTYYFIGLSHDEWNDSSNWSLSQNGLSVNLIPSFNDDVVIDKSIAINSSVFIRNLTLIGDSGIAINGSDIVLSGDLMVLNYQDSTITSTSKIIFNGVGNQKMVGVSRSYSLSTLPTIIIDKPSGKLCLKDNLKIGGDWIHIKGVVDTCCYEHVSLEILGDDGFNGVCSNCYASFLIEFSKDSIMLFNDTVSMIFEGKGNWAKIEIFEDSLKMFEMVIDDFETGGDTALFTVPNEGLLLNSGTYEILYTVANIDEVNSCNDTVSVMKQITIIENNLFEITANIVHYGVSADSSQNGIIQIESITGGVPPYKYNWFNRGDTVSYINDLYPGVYYVNITDSLENSNVFVFTIDYQVVAYSSEAFVLNDSGYIVKHSEALFDDELMLASVVFTKQQEGMDWVEAAFIGDDISFYMGFDANPDNVSGENLLYGIKSESGNLKAIFNGAVVNDIPFNYNSNQRLLLLYKYDEIKVLIDGKIVYIFNVEPTISTLRPKLGLSPSTVLTKFITNRYWLPDGRTESYATLTKNYDAGYYLMLNDIKFKYKEKYNNNSLNYKVYDWQRNVKINSVQPQSVHKYGVGYHTIDNAYNYLEDNQMYTLEVENDKGEIYKLKFLFEKKGSLHLPTFPTTPITDIYTGLYPCCNTPVKKCCYVNSFTPTIVSGNPSVSTALSPTEMLLKASYYFGLGSGSGVPIDFNGMSNGN